MHYISAFSSEIINYFRILFSSSSHIYFHGQQTFTISFVRKTCFWNILHCVSEFLGKTNNVIIERESKQAIFDVVALLEMDTLIIFNHKFNQ